MSYTIFIIKNMAYVYAHKTNTDNTIFYVGVGDNDNYQRSRIATGRSEAWKKKVKLSNGYTVQILYDNISYERALELEMETIAKLGRESLNEGPLVNLTAGGQGRKGITHSKETIQRIVNSEGYKNRNINKDKFKNKSYEEIYGESKAKEIRQKQSNAKRPPTKSGVEHHMYGKKRPEHSAILKGRPNPTSKERWLSDLNPMKDPNIRLKVASAKKGVPRPKLVCPYCGKEGGSGNMQRWHFENCIKKSSSN